MATGGRLVHHLFAGLSDPRNTVLFVGFQAAGTRGRQLIDRARHVKIFGQHVLVHARIETIGGMSAHGKELGWRVEVPQHGQKVDVRL
jgi:metallo-beta-lactamase family protein